MLALINICFNQNTSDYIVQLGWRKQVMPGYLVNIYSNAIFRFQTRLSLTEVIRPCQKNVFIDFMKLQFYFHKLKTPIYRNLCYKSHALRKLSILNRPVKQMDVTAMELRHGSYSRITLSHILISTNLQQTTLKTSTKNTENLYL